MKTQFHDVDCDILSRILGVIGLRNICIIKSLNEPHGLWNRPFSKHVFLNFLFYKVSNGIVTFNSPYKPWQWAGGVRAMENA